MIGFNSGSVIFPNVVQRPAPSIAAASKYSLLIPCTPAISIMKELPNHIHALVTAMTLPCGAGISKPVYRRLVHSEELIDGI